MQPTGAFHSGEFGFNFGEPFIDHAAVGFELGFAGSTKEAEAAALALEMGPGTHQSALLISQMRMLDLQRALARAGATAENLQDQAGAVQDFRIPRFFQVALLHWRQRAIHDHDAGVETFDETGNLFDLALAEKCCRPQSVEHDDAGLFDVEIDGAGKTDRLIELRRRPPLSDIRAGPAQDRLDHQRAAGARAFSPPLLRRWSGRLRR